MERLANNGASTLNGAINDSVTSLVVTSAATFPGTGNFRIIIDSELMLVTNVSGTTFTVTRGAESTIAASHSDTAAVTQIVTVAGLTQFIAENAPCATNATANCSADTNFTSGSWTDVTGCSLSLAAGTWLVIATIELRNTAGGASASTAGCKLYYGSTDLVSGEYSLLDGYQAVFPLQCIVVLSGTETVKIAGRDQGATVFAAKRYGDYDLGAANIQGTVLNAIKIAP